MNVSFATRADRLSVAIKRDLTQVVRQLVAREMCGGSLHVFARAVTSAFLVVMLGLLLGL